jgi:hypothetical protein
MEQNNEVKDISRLNLFKILIIEQNQNATTTAARKAVKGKGIDSEASRKSREDKGIQIRKDKRLDRANVERRKV